MTDSRSGSADTPPSADLDAGPLTAFQVEVAKAFFASPASRGFLLAGGAGLAAQRLTTRPTQDLDLFTSPGRGDVRVALAGLEAVAGSREWELEIVRAGETFTRLVVRRATDAVLVDLAVDAAPERPPTVTVAGPALGPEDLAGRKLIALFDRAEARDFADVYVLATRYGTDQLIELASAADAGFDRGVLATMLDSLARFADDEIPVQAEVDVRDVREFFRNWSVQLQAPGGVGT